MELLAPAGSYACFEAAINAGADAIYAGIDRFSARAYADNLTTEKFIYGIRQAHLRGVSVYLTLNTLINTSEYEEAVYALKPLYEHGLDGIILQDTGLISMLRECYPDLKLHASTQMSIMNSYGAGLMRDQGFSRIVPARELTLPEVRHIKDETGLEIECFIHGAMCYSYSGLCLMSSMIGGRSGNRGRCAGTCRLPFDTLCDGRPVDTNRNSGTAYPLSMKDMCTIDILPLLIDAGIDSFKIEGRMKSPEYVAGVTAMYRKYIDMYLNRGAAHYHIDETDRRHLNALYIRTDISSGYYAGDKGKKLITLDSPGYNGNDETYVKNIQNKYVHSYTSIPVEINAYIHAGEPALITASSGYNVVSVTGYTVEQAKNAPLNADDVRSRLAKTGDSGFEATNADADVSDDAFMPVGVLNELRRQAYNELADLIIEDNGFIAVRNAKPYIKLIKAEHSVERSGKIQFDIMITTQDQLEALASIMVATEEPNIGRLYIDYRLAMSLKWNSEEMMRISDAIGEIYLSMPAIMRDRIIRGKGTDDHGEAHRLYKAIDACITSHPEISGVLVHTIDELGYAIEHYPDRHIVTDSHVYTHNPYSIRFISAYDQVRGFTYPYELNAAGLNDLERSLTSEITGERYASCESTLIVYGYIPMMITAGCIHKTFDRCIMTGDKSDSAGRDYNDRITLKDRKGLQFTVVNDCAICTNLIYNERPLCLYNQIKKQISGEQRRIGDRYRINLSIESRDESERIIRGFMLRDDEADRFFADLPTTTGHMKRGAI